MINLFNATSNIFDTASLRCNKNLLCLREAKWKHRANKGVVFCIAQMNHYSENRCTMQSLCNATNEHCINFVILMYLFYNSLSDFEIEANYTKLNESNRNA